MEEQKDIQNIIEENLRLTQEIHAMTRSIKNYVILQRILSVVYLLLIVVPIILGIIYLPPLLNSFLSPYQELLNSTTNTVNDLKSPQGLGNIVNQAQKIINENNNK